MGLDIYLYTKSENEQNDRHHQQWHALWERKEKGEITELEFDEQSKQIDEWVSYQRVPSQSYPDHLFDRRYLRSSYNQSGFDHAVSNFIGKRVDLDAIFEPLGRVWCEDDSTSLTADDISGLQKAKNRALRVAESLKDSDRLQAMSLSPPFIGEADHMWSDYPSENEVLTWYRDEAKRKLPDRLNTYSTAKGTVFGFDTGIEVLAITLGRSVLDSLIPIIVYRVDSLDFYIQSAEIIAEFCDEAISLIQRDGSAYISWSG